ncbi:MAG TPA: glycosyltransferase family 87 protein [Candidatus Dormibacteraeota bacterium]
MLPGPTMPSRRPQALAARLAARVSWWHPALGALVALLAVTFWQPRAPMGVDFHTYLAAAEVGMSQGWGHIYDQVRVATVERQLVPSEVAQPFLSPPPVAWLAVVVSPLPFVVAYVAWAGALVIGLVVALSWAARGPVATRLVLALAVAATSWVMLATQVGQVVLLVAIGVVVGWRLLRDERDFAAGLALSLVIFKPNTAVLVPLALLVAGRYRAVAGISVVGAGILAVELLTAGPLGLSRYVAELAGPLPSGAGALTLHGALGIDGGAATAARLAIVGATLVGARRLRGRPGFLLAAAVVGSLLVAPYLHTSDLSMLVVAAWLLWQESSAVAWRLTLAGGWLVAAPLSTLVRVWPSVNRWPLAELGILAAVIISASPEARRGTGDAGGDPGLTDVS